MSLFNWFKQCINRLGKLTLCRWRFEKAHGEIQRFRLVPIRPPSDVDPLLVAHLRTELDENWERVEFRLERLDNFIADNGGKINALLYGDNQAIAAAFLKHPPSSSANQDTLDCVSECVIWKSRRCE